MKELVSVIVPCYKDFSGIEGTLKSILNQDYENIEIIISDDGSPGFNEEKKRILLLLDKKGNNITNVIINDLPKNVGTVKNCNSAIKCANGNYVKLLPPGDEFYSNTILSQCVKLMKNKSDTLLIGRTFCRNKSGKNTGEYKDSIFYRYQARHYRKSTITPTIKDIQRMKKMSEKKRNNTLKYKCVISTVSVFFPMSILQDTNGFFEEYRLLEDMPYWPYLADKGIHFEFSDIIMVLYSVGGISNNGAKNTFFYNEYKRVMNEVYIKNDNRFGYLKSINKKLRTKEILWQEININDKSLKTQIRYMDVRLYKLYKNLKYLFFNTRI